MLLTLPAEVRLKIFDHVCASGTISINAENPGLIQAVKWDIPWQISAVSKQIHEEVLTRTLKIHLDLAIPKDPQGLGNEWHARIHQIHLGLSKHLPSRICSAVTTMRFTGYATQMHLDFLALFPNLRKLNPCNVILLQHGTMKIVGQTGFSGIWRHPGLALLKETEMAGLDEDIRRIVEGYFLRYNPRLVQDGVKVYIYTCNDSDFILRLRNPDNCFTLGSSEVHDSCLDEYCTLSAW